MSRGSGACSKGKAGFHGGVIVPHHRTKPWILILGVSLHTRRNWTGKKVTAAYLLQGVCTLRV